MNVLQAQTKVAIQLGEEAAPNASSIEWKQRLELMNTAIDQWDNEEGMLWNELYTTLADAEDYEQLADGVITQFDAPADFRYPVGFIQTADSDGHLDTYDVLLPQDAHVYKEEAAANFVYITGYDGAFKINFLHAPSGGLILAGPYYKRARQLAAATDTFEMSDPYFAVNFCLAETRRLSDDDAGYNAYMSRAIDRMDGMKTRNAQVGHFQSNPIPMSMEGFGY